MDIYYFGFTSIKLRGKKTALVVDPVKRTEADGVLLTKKNATDRDLEHVSGYRVVIDGPGEYEIGGVSIVGIAMEEATTYVIKLDGMTLLHLGALTKKLSDSEFDRYPSLDILFVPVMKDVADMIAKLEPKIVVPIAFDITTLAEFLKEMGREGTKPVPKLTITKEKLPSELEVVVLE